MEVEPVCDGAGVDVVVVVTDEVEDTDATINHVCVGT